MVNRLNSSLSETSDSGIVLKLLSAVENNSSLTQRSLAKELGIALGLANAYVKRCTKKGFIKIQQVPAIGCSSFKNQWHYDSWCRVGLYKLIRLI